MNRRTVLSALLALPLAWLPKRVEAKPKLSPVVTLVTDEDGVVQKVLHPANVRIEVSPVTMTVQGYGNFFPATKANVKVIDALQEADDEYMLSKYGVTRDELYARANLTLAAVTSVAKR